MRVVELPFPLTDAEKALERIHGAVGPRTKLALRWWNFRKN